MISRDFYGGKETWRYFRDHFKFCVSNLNLTLFLDDPYLWSRPAVKLHGSDCYEHMLLCADDDLVASDNAEIIFRN